MRSLGIGIPLFNDQIIPTKPLQKLEGHIPLFNVCHPWVDFLCVGAKHTHTLSMKNKRGRVKNLPDIDELVFIIYVTKKNMSLDK